MEGAVGGEMSEGGDDLRNLERRESLPVRWGGHVIAGIRQKLPHKWLQVQQEILNNYGVFLPFERDELAQRKIWYQRVQEQGPSDMLIHMY